MITAERARAAIDAIVAASRAAGGAMAIAVVDDHGDLIAAHRMDGCRPRSMRMSHRKAYSAAVMDRDTTVFQEDVLSRGIQLFSYGDPMLSSLPGGAVVRAPGGATIGGIGVTGTLKNQDVPLADVGRKLLES
jgi:uncharacterized protein GlcG (DUF336 family)